MSQLRMMANRIDEGVTESTGGRRYGTFIEILVQLLPVFLQLFQNCPKKPKPVDPNNPQPVNPVPTPTPAQAQAWDDAVALKERAIADYDQDSADYKNRTLRLMAVRARRQRKQSGKPVSHRESLELARESLDEARTMSLPELASTIMEVQPIVATLPPDQSEVFGEAEDDEGQ